MSGPDGVGLPEWWGGLGPLGGLGTNGPCHAFTDPIYFGQNPMGADQAQYSGLDGYQQQQMNQQSMLQGQQLANLVESALFGPFGHAPRAASEPRRSRMIFTEDSVRKPEIVPDWVPPTKTQIWGLVVFCAVYLMFVGAFYWGLP